MRKHGKGFGRKYEEEASAQLQFYIGNTVGYSGYFREEAWEKAYEEAWEEASVNVILTSTI